MIYCRQSVVKSYRWGHSIAGAIKRKSLKHIIISKEIRFYNYGDN